MNRTSQNYRLSIIIGIVVISFCSGVIAADDNKENPKVIIITQIDALNIRNKDLDKQKAIQRKIVSDQEEKVARARREMRTANENGNKKKLNQAHTRLVEAESHRKQAEYLAKQKRLEQDNNKQQLNNLKVNAKKEGIALPETTNKSDSNPRDISKDSTHKDAGPLGSKNPNNLSNFTPRKSPSIADDKTNPKKIRHKLNDDFIKKHLKPYEKRAQNGTKGRYERQHQFLQSVFDGARTHSNKE